jgi:hypothetical protein
MKELIKRKNVTLHDFQSDRDIVCNGNFYSDIQHFNSKAARMILAKLKSGTRILRTEQDILENEQELRTLLKETMPEYNAQIQRFKE